MKKNPVRVNELLDLVVRDYEVNKKRSADQVKIHIKRLRPEFGDRVASLVRKSHVEVYKSQRQSSGASPATINRELAALRRAFNLGLEEEIIEKTPRFKLLAEPDPREGYYEPEEFVRFQLAARSIGCRKNFDGTVVADITLFSYYSGWRLKECLNLHKDWIHEQEQIAVLPKAFSKNKRARIFPLEGVVWEMVRLRLEHVNSEGLLFHRNGRRVKSIRRLCNTVCRVAGIPAKSFHDLRRSATTNLNRSGVDKETGKKITGHVTDSVYNRYNQASLEQLRSAVIRVQKYVDSTVQEKQVNGADENPNKSEELAERVGFEPTTVISDDTRFRVKSPNVTRLNHSGFFTTIFNRIFKRG